MARAPRLLLALLLLPPLGAPVLADDRPVRLPIELGGSLQNPAFGPDGRRIVFSRFNRGYDRGPADLCLFDLETGRCRMLVADGDDNVNLPGSSWNPATGRICFSSSREPHDEVFSIAATGEAASLRQLTRRDRRMAYEPTMSPDGAWVVFESHELDDPSGGIVMRRRTDGSGGYEQLTESTEDCRQPNWSPAGDRVVYQRRSGNRWEIWVMKADGTDRRPVVRDGGEATDASFDPTGSWIVYSCEVEGALASIFVAPVRGGPPVRLTREAGYDGAPSWSPDGRRIAFERCAGDPAESGGTALHVVAVPEEVRRRVAGGDE